MWTWLFWKGALERAIKTGAQALIGVFTGDVVGLVDAPWGGALSLAGMMMVLSVLTSIGSGFVPADPWTSPSAVRTVPRWATGAHRRPGPLTNTPQERRLNRLRVRRRAEKILADVPPKAGTEPATDGTEDSRG